MSLTHILICIVLAFGIGLYFKTMPFKESLWGVGLAIAGGLAGSFIGLLFTKEIYKFEMVISSVILVSALSLLFRWLLTGLSSKRKKM